MSFLTTTTALQFKVVEKADALQIQAMTDFVMAGRRIMFPMLDHQVIPDDLSFFQQTFIEHPLGCFIAVYEQKKLVAVAGFRAYDQRFSHLFDLKAQTVVELVKLYVLPQYRRQQIATQLVQKLKQLAHQKNIDVIYLHTQPFLAGAKAFWLQQGFETILEEQDPIWYTIHMRLDSSSFNTINYQ
ncbi:GNAT family N-acetyltransferase [Acinetobacter rathckeae]|uniref:GNAT family N-acetyltransferase n=1 Tax=Acinetobacter rathckeae TaxID=2605272 RepID=UPI0018A2F970|nr:GNAT family N-acetyltransferase [Acinetobacter rathckeae]MBF7688942.1 GNAT family N-acetyltransferase [Acinetobacter rathckeae]MBF7696341.1 GNAT family N-acetyltransferase [Acinetobacter rathckeae]